MGGSKSESTHIERIKIRIYIYLEDQNQNLYDNEIMGRRSSLALQERARIYRAALYWRVNLEIAARPRKCPLCYTRTPVRRQVFFILNYTDYNRSPHQCDHVICVTCHNSIAMTPPELEDVVGMEDVVYPNQTKCSLCRQYGRYI